MNKLTTYQIETTLKKCFEFLGEENNYKLVKVSLKPQNSMRGEGFTGRLIDTSTDKVSNLSVFVNTKTLRLEVMKDVIRAIEHFFK